MSTHHPSQVEFVLSCVAFFECDLEEEDEGEFELELGGVAVVQTSRHRAQNSLLTLLAWSPFWIQPPKSGPIQLLPL